MNTCPDCGKELFYKEYDYLSGFGATEYTLLCDCGYLFSYAYGQYEITEKGKYYAYDFRDAELIVRGLATQADFEQKEVFR